jgi:glycosyltransferase involved in cell wall biosynthesis
MKSVSTKAIHYSSLNIWLAYVSYPVTTAVYFERALRKLATVTTIGPRLPDFLINDWQLENMKLPVTDQDIVTDFTPDMATYWADAPTHAKPDLYLWIESVGGHYPQNLHAVRCPKCCYLIDNHLNLEQQLVWAQQFDYVFIAQLEYLPYFRQINSNSHWLPLACDPEIHGAKVWKKTHEISFVGSITLNPRRQKLLERLNSEFQINQQRCFWTDMAEVFSASKVVFNSAVKNDLNMRFFEGLCSGSLMLSDMAHNSGQKVLFQEGADYAQYTDDLLVDTALFYLKNNELREMIAERGRTLALNTHTYDHRCIDLLQVVQGAKQTTDSPEILRSRSLAGIEPFGSSFSHRHTYFSPADKSFVIPVLDYSPEADYNIVTLLNDLDKIAGDVLVIFNNSQVARELGTHPRITRSAIMQDNVGVARAWNIGLNMANTQTVFFLNADLHVTPEAINQLSKHLQSLPDAACIGPQGSFNCFRLTSDFLYFEHGGTDIPVAVDSVSGFFFAINKALFDHCNLMFDTRYSPCYFEEWDIGLQIRRVGYKSYVVPLTGYDHEWGGSIRALSSIECMGRSEQRDEILKRNRVLFLSKWRRLIENEQRYDLMESGWRLYGPDYCRLQLKQGNMNEALRAIDLLYSEYPDEPSSIALHGVALHCRHKTEEALEHFTILSQKHPEFCIDTFIQNIIRAEPVV